MADPVRVLFIVGTGRSGSTLLANILGSVDGAVSVGEVRHIWNRGLQEDWDCGCGLRFGECSFWQTVLHRAFPDTVDLSRLLASERELLRLRNSSRTIRSSRNPALLEQSHGYYTASLTPLYQAILQVSDAELVVDSSKTPSYAALLATRPEIDLRLLHLVRDPRAAAFSWLTPKPSPDRRGSSKMDRLGASKSAALWVWWNSLAEALARSHPDLRYLRLTYEGFTSDPQQSLRRVAAALIPELETVEWPLRGRQVSLGTCHTVSGNADRTRRGPVDLEADDRWRQGLRARDRASVTMIGGPLMKRYGYRLTKSA